jgi:beta-barrel assembly-enhancing protease
VCVGVWRFCSQAVCYARLAGPISKLPPLASEEVEAERRKQQVDHIRDYFDQRRRLNNVAFRIRTANHRDCKNRSAQIGLEAGTVPSLPRKFRSFSHEALSVSWTRATVLSVAETDQTDCSK